MNYRLYLSTVYRILWLWASLRKSYKGQKNIKSLWFTEVGTMDVDMDMLFVRTRNCSGYTQIESKEGILY